jgi:D-3-phosphoglycerate dehydrogenase
LASIRRILLPQPIEKDAFSLLEAANLEIVLAPDKQPETIARLLKGAQAVILRTGITFNKELMNHADDLWVISRTGAGVDNVDVAAATEMGILVTSIPGGNTNSVVEHVVALIFALAKQLFLMDREVRQNHFGIRFKNIPRDLRGKTLGVVGLGRIGSELARICFQTFGMSILGYDPYLTSEAKALLQGWVQFSNMEKLFRQSDVVSIHIPLMPNTQKLIGDRELGWMKPDAFIINTSRGGVLDEEALIRCLTEKRIAGAGLDVFVQEPLEKDSPLKKLDNAILTPHTAALTRECVVRQAMEAAKAVIEIHRGKTPSGMVNPEVLLKPRWQGFLGVTLAP